MSSWWKKKRKLTVDEVVTIGIKIVKLLWKLHSIGWIHRDVKPGNFLFGRDRKRDKLHIIDFGLSRKIKPNY